MITFGGTPEPCALVHYQSIGNISPEENRSSSEQIFKQLQTDLNISPERVFINYFNLDSNNVAWNGRIFRDILADKKIN